MVGADDEAPEPRMLLRAGPVSAVLDGPDLRYVKVGESELVRRVYVAVRDVPWNTIPAEYSDWTYELGEDGFRVSFRASHRHEDIHFDWAGVISGSPDGVITYEMDGSCAGIFEYNKIGFNIHHDLEGSVGHRYRAQTDDGELTGMLPVDIEPQRIVDGIPSAMFAPYSELAIEVADSLESVVRLEGDLLELQDHRNWTDANFKSYGTPLALGFPFQSADGQRIRQLVTIGYVGPTPPPAVTADPEVRIGGSAIGRLPSIGLGMASHETRLSDAEAELLQVLKPAHLRADLRLGEADHLTAFERAAADAAVLGTALELAVYTSDSGSSALESLAERLRAANVTVARVLVYPAADGFSAVASTTPPATVSLVRRHLEPVIGSVVFAGGTDQSFVDINRDRPSGPAFTGVCFSISPSVHAADDWSIIENLVAQSQVVRMARSFSGDRAICVSPVTMATRFGPYPAGPSQEGDLPPAVDVRQASLLGAAWTVGSLAALTAGGADSATYFETTGWRGVIETDSGPPMPHHFPSHPGQVFPLYHVLADVAEWGAGEALQSESSDPLRVVVLAMRDEEGAHALVANVTPEPQRILIRGIAEGTRVRMLDEVTAQLALDDPMAYRATPTSSLVSGQDDAWWLGLGPFAVARLDAAAGKRARSTTP